MAASSMLAFVGCDDDDTSNPGAGGSAEQGGAAAVHAGAPGHGGADGHGGAGGHGAVGHGDGAVICKVIGQLCHAADTGSGAAHDCHELGHVGNAEACVDAFDGCITLCTADDAGGGGAGGGGAVPDAYCAALGELCHAVDDSDGPLHDCHEVGHVGNAAACAAEFDACATLCLAAREQLVEGAGGAGNGGAGGVNSGGVSSAGGTAPSGGAAQ